MSASSSRRMTTFLAVLQDRKTGELRSVEGAARTDVEFERSLGDLGTEKVMQLRETN